MTSRIVLSQDRALATSVSWARDFRERTRGLIGRPALTPGAAFVIERAPQVHTFGMTYAIDVVFCDADWRVIHTVRRLRPGRITRWMRGARYTIEMAGDAVPPDVRPGDLLSVEK